MTFNPNIPNAGDFLSDSQGQLKTNFTALNNSFSRNHVPFSTVTNNGKHTFMEMVLTAGSINDPPTTSSLPAPVPGLTSSTGTLYTLRRNSITDLFYTNDNSGRAYRLTNCVGATDYAKLGIGPNGWTFMGQGIIMQYGRSVATSTSSVAVVFPVTFNIVPYSVQVTGVIDDNSTVRLSVLDASVTTTGFSTNQSSTSHLKFIYWTAVGYFG